MKSSWLRSETALLVVLLAVACGGREQPDDGAFHRVAQQGSSNVEVVFNATVTATPVQSGDHEHLEVRAATGETLEIDHNLGLSRWVPAKPGDHVVIEGRFYDDGGRLGVHCTHAHTSAGCPVPGWIELRSTYYE